MKIFILLLASFMSFSTFAGLIDYGEFIRMTDKQKVEVVVAYKKFLAEQSMPLGEDKKVSLVFNLINEAFAAAGDDCFFAGWPSKVRASGKRQYCTSPANANPDYQAQASKCSGSQMLCNPVLFGEVGCIPAATQAQKNMAFATCERKFSSSGKSISDIAASLSDPAKRSSAEAMFATANQVCGAGGFQASKPMCRNLSSKVASIRSAAPAVQAVADTTTTTGSAEGGTTTGTSTTGAVADGAATTSTGSAASGGESTGASDGGADRAGGVGLAVDVLSRDPREVLHPGSENCTEDEHNHRRQDVPQRDTPITKVTCAPASLDGVPQTREELMRELEQNGVSSVTNPIPDDQLANVRAFVAEMRKFPQPILQDMKNRGGRILIMTGEGVTADPNFQGQDTTPQQLFRQRQLASVPGNTEGWRWSQTPGAGGAIAPGYQKEPTRIVINHLYDRHGSSNLFIHEHAHMLDSFDGLNSISNSNLWGGIINGPGRDKLNRLMRAINPAEAGQNSYLTQFKSEGFAELFSYYHACDESKNQVKEIAPELANFFDSISSLRDLKRRMNSSSIVYIYRK